jgi:glycerol uptake facilitator-like aquaporin
VGPPATPSTRSATWVRASSTPIKHKGGSNWGYSWVPVVGPLIGAVLAGLFSHISI